MKIVFEPVRFFSERAKEQPAWGAVVASISLIAIGRAGIAIVMGLRGQAALRPPAGVEIPAWATEVSIGAAAMGTVVGFLLWYGVMLAVILGVNALRDGGGGRARKLIECTGLALSVCVPWVFLHALSVWLWFHPRPFTSLNESSMTLYWSEIGSLPLISTVQLVDAMFLLYVVALQSVALHVVGGLSVKAASIVGTGLGLVFVVVPWAIQRF